VEIILSFTLCFYQQEAALLLFIWFNVQIWSNGQTGYLYIQAATAITKILSQGLNDSKGSERAAKDKALNRLKKVRDQNLQTFRIVIPYNIMIAWWPWLRGNMAYGNFLFIPVNIGFGLQLWLLHPPALEETKSPQKNEHAGNHVKSTHGRSTPKVTSPVTELLRPSSPIPISSSMSGTGLTEEVGTQEEETHLLMDVKKSLEPESMEESGSGIGRGQSADVERLTPSPTSSYSILDVSSSISISPSSSPPPPSSSSSSFTSSLPTVAEERPIFNPFQ